MMHKGSNSPVRGRGGHSDPVTAVKELRAASKPRHRCGMKGTFYVATSWGNREQATEVANYLKSRGMRWALDHNWPVDGKVGDIDSPATSLIAYLDIQAAVAADLFVILLRDPLTVGCHAEFGARISHGKEAHLVRQGTERVHPFHKHPCVVEHEDVIALITHLFGA